MSEHTKEPWKIGNSFQGLKTVICTNKDDPANTAIAFTVSRERRGFDGCAEDARRIVACVNACAGMMTEDLEEGEIQKIRDEHRELRKNIDIAIAALEDLAKEYLDPSVSGYKARDALEKIKAAT